MVPGGIAKKLLNRRSCLCIRDGNSLHPYPVKSGIGVSVAGYALFLGLVV